MKISKYISSIPNNGILLTVNNLNYTKLDLLKKAVEFKKFSKIKSSDTVVLQRLGIVDFIISIIALDGFVNKIYFLPDNIDLENIEYSVLLRNELTASRFSENKDFIKSETEWILFTSGTTDKPKMISHTLTSLTQSCKSYDKDMASYKWILTYDVNRFAGIQVILQSLISGNQLFIPDKFSFRSILSCILSNQPNCISCTPSFFRKLLLNKDFQKLQFYQITLGGEIADTFLLNLITRKFPTSRLIHIYASTELGVGFSVKDKKSGFPKVWLENPELAPLPMKVSSRSTLLLKPKVKPKGKEITLRTNENFLDTLDMVQVDDDRVFLQAERMV